MTWVSFLSELLSRRGAPALAHLRITLYSRRGCHLCDEALQCLEAQQRRYGYILTPIDVDSDADLVARYGEQVPVVAVDGKVRFRGGVNAILLERLLTAEARRHAERSAGSRA